MDFFGTSRDHHHGSRFRMRELEENEVYVTTPTLQAQFPLYSTTSISGPTYPKDDHVSHECVPRGWGANEQMDLIMESDLLLSSVAGFSSHNQHIPDSNNQYNHKAAKVADTDACTPMTNHDSEASSEQSKRAVDVYNSAVWEEKRLDLETLFLTLNYSQKEVLQVMRAQGFHPSLPAFKRKVGKWGWKTYNGSGQRKRAHKKGKRHHKRTASIVSSPATVVSPDNISPSGSSPGTATDRSPVKLFFTNSSLQLPMNISKTPYHLTFQALIEGVKQLYDTHLPGWKVHNGRDIEEDEHDDLLVGVGNSLRCLDQFENTLAHHGMRKAFYNLRKVVGTKKTESCGFFSLPAILQVYLRLREHNELMVAQLFLRRAIKFAEQRYIPSHPFVRILVYLQQLRRLQEVQELERYQNLQHLEDLIQANFQEFRVIIFGAYWACIQATERLGNQNMSYLQLWGDFVVYGDKTSARSALDNIHQTVQTCEEKNGSYDDDTIMLLGMKLYVLQSTPSMTAEAEATAKKMMHRLVKRFEDTGKELEGDMLITWKDLRHTLANFYYARKDYDTAIWYMEEYLKKGIEDERDLFALKKLEEWYFDLGDAARGAKTESRSNG